MNDMSSTIVAKSDQINAADLIGSPRTVVVREVRIKAGDDQPVSVLIEGDQKAFRPCKGVRRLMVRVWGADASKYIGQAMTLFCDPSVTWAGKEEGGIRVSHMTGLDEPIVEFMRTSRAATKPYKVLPLKAEPDRAAVAAANLVQRINAASLADLPALVADPLVVKQRAWLAANRTELAAQVDAAVAAKDDDDPFGSPPIPEAGAVDPQDDGAPSACADLLARINAAAFIADVIAIEASYQQARDMFDIGEQDQIEKAIEDARAKMKGGK